jgi:hypothetical protein
MTDRTLRFDELTLAQCQQVAHDFTEYTDPSRYLYQADRETGTITGRYIPAPVRARRRADTGVTLPADWRD